MKRLFALATALVLLCLLAGCQQAPAGDTGSRADARVTVVYENALEVEILEGYDTALRPGDIATCPALGGDFQAGDRVRIFFDPEPQLMETWPLQLENVAEVIPLTRELTEY